ncbi:hypothetical protein [Paraurantiacibacter namhicola]|uniref:Uncharacterized protein n=1 Tax=Paraurantiacibacter namhicola TaxID=645517 RepID=A0A1C7D6Q9_9SPHN|nr:hypothetical protein [Paraurantiacibacter namhicola]ANU06993.1 hypothetical protein A6F65_00671 [Paraurantiacibacter namhicola]
MSFQPKLSAMDRLVGSMLCRFDRHRPESRRVGWDGELHYSTCIRCRGKIVRGTAGGWRKRA